ncbi:uncharacterized protein LOC115818168 [Chanos chanos]|uniref:Uncharacterized protein LOC115818168 n=1 Tax=Chanos chanos TaxID=29144 RepID=A0A6J2VZN6_CHACN|nr:uncharacterized protein LOC115818168 [Chanos chanos]
MAILWIAIYLVGKLYVAQAMSVYQTSTVISAQLGDAVTLHCFFPEETSNDQLFWYKQRVGNKPQVVVVTNQVMNPLFYKEFEDSRFRLNKTKKSMSLTIGKTVPSDEAMYFCAKRSLYETEFSNGTFLAVKGDHQSSYISVQQISMSGPFHPGDSVTLECTVLTERSSAELSVFWFRLTSDESRPVMIYTYKNRSDQCESGSPRQSCVSNLYKNNLSLSDAGTYYCAVATLGKIVIGDGAMLDIGRRECQSDRELFLLLCEPMSLNGEERHGEEQRGEEQRGEERRGAAALGVKIQLKPS